MESENKFCVLTWVKDTIWLATFLSKDISVADLRVQIDSSSKILEFRFKIHWNMRVQKANIPVLTKERFWDKPLSEPMLAYCQLNTLVQTTENVFIGIQIFEFKKLHSKMPVKWRPFFSFFMLILWIEPITITAWHFSYLPSSLVNSPHQGNTWRLSMNSYGIQLSELITWIPGWRLHRVIVD